MDDFLYYAIILVGFCVDCKVLYVFLGCVDVLGSRKGNSELSTAQFIRFLVCYVSVVKSCHFFCRIQAYSHTSLRYKTMHEWTEQFFFLFLTYAVT